MAPTPQDSNRGRLTRTKGADKVWRLVEDGAPGVFKVQGQIDQPAGSGPRHIAVRGMLSTVLTTYCIFTTCFTLKGTRSTRSTSSRAP